MGLIAEIEKESSQIQTDSYPMSIGELRNLYLEGEIDVHPEFQRVYRWTESQKTRLIESLLLGIPIPQIFVAQRQDGVWDVVDGQQRLSTILEFFGELKDEKGELVPPLVLQKTKFLPSLEGKVWDKSLAHATKTDGPNEKPWFTRELQMDVKRKKIGVNIVLKQSDSDTKYELFMRLNTGGSPLEPQEVRNCLMLMAFPDTYRWIQRLSENPDFLSCVSLSDRRMAEQYPMELATRFILFRTLSVAKLKKVGDIGDFLNENLKTIHQLKKSKKKEEKRIFERTFEFINQEIGENGFRRYSNSKGSFTGGFAISGFEAVAMGVGFSVSDDIDICIEDFPKKVKSLWSDNVFTGNSGSGVRASTRIPKIVPHGREVFSCE